MQSIGDSTLLNPNGGSDDAIGEALSGGGGGQIVMDLQQTGAQVTGNVTVSGPAVNRPTTIQAVVTGNDMKLEGRIPGTLTVSGDKMTGIVDGVVAANVTMQRQK